MFCLNCNIDTKNPKFCSKSCATTFNNRIYIKRKPEHTCRTCSNSINSKKRFYSKFCKEVYLNNKKEVRKKQIENKVIILKPNSRAVSDRRKKIKLMAIESMGGSCIICGYNKCNRALVFHHSSISV